MGRHTFGTPYCAHCDRPTCRKWQDEFDNYYEEHCPDCGTLYWKIKVRHERELKEFNAAGEARHREYLKRFNVEK